MHRPSNRLRAAIAGLALSTALALAGPAAAQPRPPLDDLPPLPKPKLPQNGEKARFKLVVEGQGTAYREVSIDGSNGPCWITSRTETSERYEYGRGKGLEVVFTRFRGLKNGPVFLRRVGRRAPGATFNVRGWYQVFGEGTASRSGPAAMCLPVSEPVGDEPECNRKVRARADIAVLYADGKLHVEERSDRIRAPGCGTNSVETLSQSPLLGWFGLPETQEKPLAPKLIFGRKRRFKVRLTSGVEAERHESPIPQFPGQTLDTGEHDVVVRFIRLRR